MGYKIGHMEGFFRTQSHYFQSAFLSENGLYFVASLLLCPINWLFEALKWQVAASRFLPISLRQSLNGVVTGQALNLVIPASVGHVAGRVMNLKNASQSKLQVASLVVVCNTAQFVVTFLAFALGFLFLGNELAFFNTDWLLIFCCSLLLIGLAYALFNRFKNQVWIIEFLMGIKQIDIRSLVKIFTYSTLRYITFSSQFVLMLYFLGVEETWMKLAMAISLVFMAKSIMPSFSFLSDLGVREFAALLFLPAIGLPETVVVAGSLWVWLVNIFLPSMTGAFLLLRTKLNYLFC